MRDEIDELASEVKAAGLTRHEVESILFQLSPAQRRLFLRLSAGGSALTTTELRTACSVGSISTVALALNEKLRRVGDARRVICAERSHPHQIGTWRLVRGSGERAAA